ncbi:MAG: hypothetical protein M1286_02015 [Candidatus Marsarchaeota archaeon]|nr:hypothetical protein [Candidatus Marsarchaeota archaeon]
MVVLGSLLYYIVSRTVDLTADVRRFALGILAGLVLSIVAGFLLGAVFCGLAIGAITKSRKASVLLSSFIIPILGFILPSLLTGLGALFLAWQGLTLLLITGFSGLAGALLSKYIFIPVKK